MAEPQAIRVRITGRVQGVGFRAWTQRQASALGVSGWVRNCAGGEVEALLSGPAEKVAALQAALSQGPRGAAVSAVEVLGPAEPCEGPFTIAADRSN